MPVTTHIQRVRRLAWRTLRDPLGVGRFRPDVALEADDLPGLDRENRIHA